MAIPSVSSVPRQNPLTPIEAAKPAPASKIKAIDLAIAITTVALCALAGLGVALSLALPVGICVASGAFLGAMVGLTAISIRKFGIYPRIFAKLSPELAAIVERTPQFNDYKISLPTKLNALKDLVVTGMSVRPANLFFDSMLKTLTNGNVTTQPGPKPKLFAFEIDHGTIARHIRERADADEVIKFSAVGLKANAIVGNTETRDVDLEDIYGSNEYQISYKEVLETLESQKIYTSSDLPLEFYRGLKTAMENDGLVELRYVRDKNGKILRKRPPVLRDLLSSPQDSAAVVKYLSNVKNDPKKYGFRDEKQFQRYLSFTTYQIGAMIVKSEDYRVFVDGNGKIIKREVGEKDAIRLLNACGVRPDEDFKLELHTENRFIMKETFKAAFAAAESGIVVFPAVGMGVWGGNPEVYWRALLDAVMETPQTFDAIFVNPNHAPSKWPNFLGNTGEEFDVFLKKYIDENTGTDYSLKSTEDKLRCIHNLREKKTDIVQLARELKKSYPEKNISLFNASDPDVTLGNHVGQYTNTQPTATTTEENYTAIGTNGLCFETITDVHHDLNRLFQVEKGSRKAVSAATLGLPPKRSVLGRVGNVLNNMADIKFS